MNEPRFLLVYLSLWLPNKDCKGSRNEVAHWLVWSRVQTKCCYGEAELEVSVHLRGAGIYNVYLSFSKSK